MESTKPRGGAKKRFEKWLTFTRAFPTSSLSCTISPSKCAWRWRRSSGWRHYTELAYRNMGRLDWHARARGESREQIRTVITPAVDCMRKAQAKRLGLDSKSNHYDESLTFAGGNADPIGAKIIWWGRRPKCTAPSPRNKGILRLHDEVRVAWPLRRVRVSTLAATLISLPEYKSTVYFFRTLTALADVDVSTHEAWPRVPGISRRALDSDRCFAGLYGARCARSTRCRWSFSPTRGWINSSGDRATNTVMHICAMHWPLSRHGVRDEFQHEVYKNPKMTAKERRGVWRSIEKKIYAVARLWRQRILGKRGGFWMQKQHIFLHLFYYIDYALAQICTFFFYDEMKKDRESALGTLFEAVQRVARWAISICCIMSAFRCCLKMARWRKRMAWLKRLNPRSIGSSGGAERREKLRCVRLFACVLILFILRIELSFMRMFLTAGRSSGRRIRLCAKWSARCNAFRALAWRGFELMMVGFSSVMRVSIHIVDCCRDVRRQDFHAEVVDDEQVAVV